MYTLECRFFINEHRRININKKTIEIYSSKSITCSLLSREKMDNDDLKEISKSTNLVVKCNGFETEKEARYFSSYVFFTLNYIGFKYNINFTKVSNNSSTNKKWIREMFPNEIDEDTVLFDESPIIVYEMGAKTKIVNTNIEHHQELDDDEIFFESSMNKMKKIQRSEFVKINQSMELLNSTITEKNQKVKLLNMIMSLELLTNLLTEKEKLKSNRQLDLIGIATDAIKEATLNDQEIHSLVSSLGNLRNKSMRDQLLFLINKTNQPSKVLDYSLSKFLTECYRIRSSIVHGNDLSKIKILQKFELPKINYQLSKITLNLVEHLVLKINGEQ